MAKKEHAGNDDEQHRQQSNQNAQGDEDQSENDALSPEEYLALQESGNMGSYLFPEEQAQDDAQDVPQEQAQEDAPESDQLRRGLGKVKEEAAPEAQAQEAQGKKGKILTSDGLEYE